MIIFNLITDSRVMRQSAGESLLNERLPIVHLTDDAVITVYRGGGHPPLGCGKPNALGHSPIASLGAALLSA